VGWDLGTARDRVRVARRLGELPLIDDALRRGEVSYSKVRAMVRVATAENQELLLTFATKATAAHLEKICRRYQAVQRAAKGAREGDPPRRYRTRRELDDGMVRVEVVLHAEEAEQVWTTACANARRVSAETCSPVDGFMGIFHQAARGDSTRVPVELVVTVPADVLPAGEQGTAELDSGAHVSAETVRRLACDAGVVRVVESATGEILDVGRKTRTIPTAIKRALACRDQTCRFPGCTNKLVLDGHHIEHWANGGETRLGNLLLLCGHHRCVHEQGFRVVLDEHQHPTFYDPRGRVVKPIPPRPRLSAPGLPTITAANENANVTITPDTNRCGWDGVAVQYDACLYALNAVEAAPGWAATAAGYAR
jgi:hypothetical protein